MSTLMRERWGTFVLAGFTLVAALVALVGAVHWYGHPCPGVLVDPDGAVSSLGLPSWEGVRGGLRFPDRVLAIDGEDLSHTQGRDRAAAWDRAIDRAWHAGHRSVAVRVATPGGTRALALTLRPLEPLAWWMYAGGLFVVALLYLVAALLAVASSPGSALAATFARTAVFASLYLFTLFDLHTSRVLVPLFYVAFPMAPMGLIALALRLPDDVPAIRRWPALEDLSIGAGLTLSTALIVTYLLNGDTIALREFGTAWLGVAMLFFAAVFVVRFALARGARRTTMRALLLSIVPVHVVIAVGCVLATLSLSGTTVAWCALPALALTPLSTVVGMIRNDLWGSRALLSRVLIRTVIAVSTCATAAALGAVVAMGLGQSLGAGLAAASVAAIASSALLVVVLRVSDRGLFPARAHYKPTIEQLSEDLTLRGSPTDVAGAVERTVRRWLPCESVAFDVGDATRLGGPLSPPDVRSDELTLPVAFSGQTLGTLRVVRRRGGPLFTSEDIDLLRTIANLAALAIAYARSYAELEHRRREQAAAWRGERTALVETLAAEIAHEVRYPINFFRSIFRRGLTAQQLDAEEVDIGCEEVERLERLVSGLRRVTSHRLEREPVGVRELAQRAEMLLRDALGARRVTLDVEGPPDVRCDPDQATQILVNLLSNALDAAGAEGHVGIHWSLRPDGSGALSVWDTGPGFEGAGASMFAAWFTTKPNGTGLGLAITHRLVRAHNWTIEPERHAGVTRFVVGVPASDVVVASPADEVEVA